MKITKSKLRQIIKEEIESIQEMKWWRFGKTTTNIPTSRLMQAALEVNKIPSLDALIELKPEHAELIDRLNVAAERTKYSMGNQMSLGLAILHLKDDNLEPAESFLRKREM
jgi:hypothetical protein